MAMMMVALEKDPRHDTPSWAAGKLELRFDLRHAMELIQGDGDNDATLPRLVSSLRRCEFNQPTRNIVACRNNNQNSQRQQDTKSISNYRKETTSHPVCRA